MRVEIVDFAIKNHRIFQNFFIKIEVAKKGVGQIKSPVEILFMSLEIKKQIGDFGEIRFLSKS